MDPESIAFVDEFSSLWVGHYNDYWETKLDDGEMKKRVENCADYMSSLVEETVRLIVSAGSKDAQSYLSGHWQAMLFDHVLTGQFRDDVQDDPDERYVNDPRYHQVSNLSEELWGKWLMHINKKHGTNLRYDPDGNCLEF